MIQRLAVIVLTLLVIVGCSNRIGYRFADTFIAWKLADYVALSGTLEEDIGASISELHRWHAQTQLPIYRAHLAELRLLIINDDLTETDISRYSDSMASWWDTLRVRIEPYALRYLPALSEPQRRQIIDKIQSDIDEEKDEINTTEFAEVLKRRQKRMENTLSDALGRLESGQLRYLRRWIQQREDLRLTWLDYQQLWLDEFSTVLLAFEQPQYQQRLKSLIIEPEQMRSEDLQQAIDRSREATFIMLYSIYQSLTPKQRHKLVRTLDGYLSDLDSLIEHYAN